MLEQEYEQKLETEKERIKTLLSSEQQDQIDYIVEKMLIQFKTDEKELIQTNQKLENGFKKKIKILSTELSLSKKSLAHKERLLEKIQHDKEDVVNDLDKQNKNLKKVIMIKLQKELEIKDEIIQGLNFKLQYLEDNINDVQKDNEENLQRRDFKMIELEKNVEVLYRDKKETENMIDDLEIKFRKILESKDSAIQDLMVNKTVLEQKIKLLINHT